MGEFVVIPHFFELMGGFNNSLNEPVGRFVIILQFSACLVIQEFMKTKTSCYWIYV